MTFDLTIKGKRYMINVIECDHTVPCVGYGFTEIRSKLKPEFEGLTGQQIGAKKREKIEVTADTPFPQFCFLGDSTTKVFDRSPSVFNYPVIICECTFLMPDDYDNAVRKKHTHWSDLKPIVMAHPGTTFILYHFSARYRTKEVWSFFEKEKEENSIGNIVVWIPVP